VRSNVIEDLISGTKLLDRVTGSAQVRAHDRSLIGVVLDEQDGQCR